MCITTPTMNPNFSSFGTAQPKLVQISIVAYSAPPWFQVDIGWDDNPSLRIQYKNFGRYFGTKYDLSKLRLSLTKDMIESLF